MSRTYISRSLRERVAEQAGYRCGYCLSAERVVGTPMEVDHIIPEAFGGRTEEANLWLACSLCNDHKNARIAALDPQSGEVVRLFDPRRQVWKEHFCWAAEGDRIVGLTPTGRATILALNLNRPTVVRARQLWVSVGWHPPKDDGSARDRHAVTPEEGRRVTMRLYRGVAVCLAAALLVGGLALAGDADKEQKALQGKWEVTQVTDNGKAVPEAKFKGVQFVFAGDKLKMVTSKGDSEEFRFKLDPAKKPHHMDLTQNKDKTPAIYEVKGDTLKLALPPKGHKDRPTEFESKEGSRVSLVTLKKAK